MNGPALVRGLLLTALLAAGGVVAVPAQTTKPKGIKAALLIGVRTYERSVHFADLKYTENDVEKLAAQLKQSAGFTSVRVLTTTRGEKDKDDAPTAANIRKALLELVDDRKKDDSLLIALSGHGIELEVEDPDGQGRPRHYSYFCPSDADLVNVSYSSGRSKRLVGLNEVLDGLGKCGAGVKLVVMDACRNEMKAEGSTRSLDAESVRIPRGVGALFSCSSGQKAFESGKLEHGVFFHYVIEGLKGEAKNRKGEITWASLAEYVADSVQTEVPKLIGAGAKQTPHPFTNIPGTSPVLVARSSPGKEPVVKEGPEEVFKTHQKAVKEKDHKTVLACFSPQATDELVFVGLAGWLALTSVLDTLFEAPDKKKVAAAREVLRRHGLTDEDQKEIAEQFDKLRQKKVELEKFNEYGRSVMKRIKDKPAIYTTVVETIDQLEFTKKAKAAAKPTTNSVLKDVTITGDTATAKHSYTSDGKELSDTVRFTRVNGRWYLSGIVSDKQK